MNPGAFRFATHAALVLSLVAGLAATGSANSSGRTGVSGKEATFCRNCHGGGTPPTVLFEGPTTASPGSILTFRFVVQSNSGNEVAAGFNVAASDGVLGAVAGQDVRVEFDELTHNNPRPNDANARAVFEFTWRAPVVTGAYTLYGAGASVNLDGKTTGDAAAKTTYVVVVADSSPTPTRTPAPPTPTATSPRTPGGGPCVGDCDGSGSVSINELISGVNISLGSTALGACAVFDADGDGGVAINELIQAVNNALGSCPAR